MEKTCKNCEYFATVGFRYPSPVWGDCTKPRECVADVRAEEGRDVFTWEDKTCSDFKPKQEPA